MYKSLFKSDVSILVLINILLAAVSVLRDVFLAAYLGTSVQADAFLLAFFLPEMVGNSLLAAAIGVACIPAFSRMYVLADYQSMSRAVTRIACLAVLAALCLMTIMYLLSEEIIISFGKGFPVQIAVLSQKLYTLMLPTIIAYPVITVGSSLLQVFGSFSLPAFAPVVFNCMYLAAAVFLILAGISVDNGVYLLSYAVTASVITMGVMIVWGIRKEIPALKPACKPLNYAEKEIIRETLRLFYPYLFILFCTQSILFVERFLASMMEPGSIAGLNYAYRIAQFPLWVFIAALNTVIFPSMSKNEGIGNEDGLKKTLHKAFKMVLLITLPITIAFFLLRDPIVTILLQRGAFDSFSSQTTAGILAGYAMAITGLSITCVGIRAFLARGKIFYPIIAGIVSALITVGLDYIFAKEYGAAGLGYGAAIGAAINAAIIIYQINKELKLIDDLMSSGIFKIFLANLPLLLVLIQLRRLWSAAVFHNGLLFQGLYAVVVMIISLATYYVSLKVLKISLEI